MSDQQSKRQGKKRSRGLLYFLDAIFFLGKYILLLCSVFEGLPVLWYTFAEIQETRVNWYNGAEPHQAAASMGKGGVYSVQYVLHPLRAAYIYQFGGQKRTQDTEVSDLRKIYWALKGITKDSSQQIRVSTIWPYGSMLSIEYQADLFWFAAFFLASLVFFGVQYFMRKFYKNIL